MKSEKQKNKEITINELAGLMKQGFKKNQNEMTGTVKIMLDAFQSNQEYMDKRFNAIGEDLRHIVYTVDKIDKKLDSQEKVIFNHDGRIDKLEVDSKKVKKALAI